MTVTLCGLAKIRMAMSLLEIGVQLMILATASFHTMNAFQYWSLKSSLQERSCVPPSSVVVSPNPVHLTSARPRMSHHQCFNLRVSFCTFLQACRERMYRVPIAVPSFGSPMVVFAPAAHLSPTPWSPTVGCMAIFFYLGLNWSGMMFLC